MQISNQKPVILSHLFAPPMAAGYDIPEIAKELLAKPLMEPLSQGTPVTITDNGKDVTEDDITKNLLACMGDSLDLTAEDWIKELYAQSLIHYKRSSKLRVRDIFAVQAGTKEKMSEPNSMVLYTAAADILPVSKEFIAGLCTPDKLFASFAYFARTESLGFYFINEAEFNDCKAWIKAEASKISANLSADVISAFADFDNLTLSALTESLRLRNDESENLDEYSFARVLMTLLMEYASSADPLKFGVMPFDIAELLLPQTMIFVNVEKHARASATAIKKEWEIIQKAISQPFKVVSTKKLNKLTSVHRTLHKMAQAPVKGGRRLRFEGVSKAATKHFKSTPPSRRDMAKSVKSRLNKMANVNRSDNSYKTIKSSFARANRRDPDNYNLQGRITSTKYKPNIHIYLDTSGSISEINYEASIKDLIKMTQSMNVDLYFNSFSHVISDVSHVKTKGKTVMGAYKAFQKIPKVSGGTDFSLVWEYINRSRERQKELSILITDFEYWAPSSFIRHPKNLYYIPIGACNWDSIKSHASSFCQSMAHIDPFCRNHILF